MKNIYIEMHAPERSTVKTASSNDMVHLSVFHKIDSKSKLVGIIQIWPCDEKTMISACGSKDEQSMVLGAFTEKGKLTSYF